MLGWPRENTGRSGACGTKGSNRFLPGVDAESTFIENVSRSDLPKLGEICRRFLVGLDRQQMEEVSYRSG